MAARIAAAGRIAGIDAITALLDAGAGAGYIQIRSGTLVDIDAASVGTLGATLALSATAFAGATDNGTEASAVANAITDDSSADANITAAHFVAFDSNNVARIGGTVGTVGSGADLEVNTTSLTIGSPVSITSWIFRLPELQS